MVPQGRLRSKLRSRRLTGGPKRRTPFACGAIRPAGAEITVGTDEPEAPGVRPHRPFAEARAESTAWAARGERASRCGSSLRGRREARPPPTWPSRTAMYVRRANAASVCPSHTATCLALRPLANSIEAHVCRSEWKPPRAPRPPAPPGKNTALAHVVGLHHGAGARREHKVVGAAAGRLHLAPPRVERRKCAGAEGVTCFARLMWQTQGTPSDPVAVSRAPEPRACGARMTAGNALDKGSRTRQLNARPGLVPRRVPNATQQLHGHPELSESSRFAGRF
jgi:hypothetical protein